MTKEAIRGFLVIVFVGGEILSGFSSNTMHFLLGMTLLTYLNDEV